MAAALALTGCSSSSSSSETPAAVAPGIYLKDTAGTAIEGATVYAIPAADVAEISSQPITLGTNGNYTTAAKAVDEPLEDLINNNYVPVSGGVATYLSGTSAANGKVALSSLPTDTGTYFLYIQTAVTDTSHLPGGSLCRTAVSGASLQGKATTIKVSTKPSDSATYVGSTVCINCHSSYATEKQTLHKLGIMVPKSPSLLQDVSKFQGATDDENFYAGLNTFETGTGTTLHYYSFNYDGNNGFKVLTSAPTGTTELFTLDLYKSASTYKVRFNKAGDPMDAAVFDVALTYGGGLHKQRYLTKIGNSLYVLPIQYNPQGSDSSPDTAGRTKFTEYNTVSGGWWLASSLTFTTPDVSKKYKAFDVFCAGCHFTGYSVTENTAGEFLSTAVADANGELHPVTGVNMEMNIGCEVCHGPGSEHQAAGGKGVSIVTPKNLTPEREVMICGACHTRGTSVADLGGGHGNSEALLDVNFKQMKPGTSRAAFLAGNTTRNDASSTDGMWADGKHSKKHHQQYTDYIQTKKYRNDSAIKTCANCHNVHAPGTDKHQLSGTSDNSLCLSCHATVDIVAHMDAKTGTTTLKMPATTLCIECHSTKTAKSGSGTPDPTEIGASSTKYYQGDISSHRLDVPMKTSISSTNTMPIPYTSGCGGCHNYSTL